MLDTRLLMDDVSLAKGLLENAAANDGKLSPSDIVFGLRNLLKMKYYPVAIKYFFRRSESWRISKPIPTTRWD